MAAWLFAAIECLFYGQADAVSSLVAIARDKAKTLEEKRARDNYMRMKHWFGCGSRSFDTRKAPPRREAYRWVRGPAGWAKAITGTQPENDAIPEGAAAYDDEHVDVTGSDAVKHPEIWMPTALLCEQADVEREARDWGQLWQVGRDYEPLFDPTDCSELQPLLASAVRMAASTFPVTTGVGVDNVAPRAFMRLSDHALQALAILLMACEAVGQ